MKINIYYGGRGLLDDPTLYVLNKMEEVLKELRVTVERINIYEHKNEIATLPQTMKDADGIILATTVEWLGIGGTIEGIASCKIRRFIPSIIFVYRSSPIQSIIIGIHIRPFRKRNI